MSVDAGFVKVSKYIIKKIPIGHLGKGLENLRGLVGGQVMDTEEVKTEIHTYGETHLSSVPNSVTNTKVVISPLTKDQDGYYYDQGQKVKFKIGLDSGEVEDAQSIEYQNELNFLQYFGCFHLHLLFLFYFCYQLNKLFIGMKH